MSRSTHRFIQLALLALIHTASCAEEAAPRPIPIVDVHFHYMTFMKPNELLERMNKTGVAAVVSAGAIGGLFVGDPRVRDEEARQAVKERYIPASGSGDIYRAEKSAGAAFYTDIQNPQRQEAFTKLLEQTYAGRRALPETFPNAENSSVDPLRRRRVPTNSAFFHELMQIAIDIDTPLPMHMEWHPESVAQLGLLLEAHPKGTVVLSHCGKTSLADEIRVFLERHSNVYCDLGYRGAPLATKESLRDPRRMIYWPTTTFRKANIKPDWLKLIEDFPDRFMVAVDDVRSWDEYDEVVDAIRTGVLDKLSPTTAQKVAFRNAAKVYRLPDSVFGYTSQ